MSGGGIAGSRRRTQIGGQFSARLIEMLESPAYRALTLSAHLVLSRLEIEHAHHGGTENGNLPCKFSDFEKYGIHHDAISSAIKLTVALGFVEITERGRAGNREFRRPSKYRLTYRPSDAVRTRDGCTHEWRKISTEAEAKDRVLAARAMKAGRSFDGKKKPFGRSAKKQKTTPGFRSSSTPDSGVNRKSFDPGIRGYGVTPESGSTSISRVRDVGPNHTTPEGADLPPVDAQAAPTTEPGKTEPTASADLVLPLMRVVR